MTQTLMHRSIESAGARSVAKWSHAAAAVASTLLLAVPTPAPAADIGSVLGGVFGGMIGQMQRPAPQYYQPAPQYYQPAPQYYQSAPHYQNQQSSAAAAAARKRQAELKKQKEEEKEKKDQEAAAAAAQPAPAAGDGSGPVDVPMSRKNGNLWVPAQINKVVTIDFVIDSGASDITLPRDVYLTLIRSGTLTKANYIGNVNFGIADGSEVKGVKFKLASLQVGNQVLTDVVASVMPSDSATPLLGLSFLSRFQSWAIDNNSGTLKLTPIGGGNPAAGTATQTAAATPRALPDLNSIPAPGSAQSAPASAQAAAPAPQVPAPMQAAAALTAEQSQPAPAAAPAVPQTAAATPLPAAPSPAPTVTASAPQATAATLPTVMPAPVQAAPDPRVATATPDAPRSGRVASSVFLAKENVAAPTPPAATPPATQTASLAKPETTTVVPVFPANTPYANARFGLLALGYGPASLPDAGKCDSNTDTTCFPERMACVKAEGIQCDFLWRRGEQLIRVRTVAIPPTISSVECQVNCK